jgi:hypothetical protein
MKRRTVLQAGASLAAAPLLSRLAQADDAGAPAAPCERIATRIGQNHGHVFQVSVAEVTAAVEKTYDLTGTASHSHSVTLAAGDFTRLRAGEVLRLPSTRDGHLHRLLVRCAPAVDPPEKTNVCKVQIGGKDDHDLVITAADMAAKGDRSYDIQGVSIHTHTVTVSAADFQKLGRGEQLTLTTSPSSPGGDHTHVVYVQYPAKTPGGP